MTRRGFRVVAVALVALVALATLVPAASAHAYLGDSNPANGEQLEEVPGEVALSFTGDGIQVADVVVRGPDGEDVSGDAEVDAEDTREVAVPVEDAGEGMYVVEWEVLADDGHTTSGTFFFSVGDEPLDRDAVVAAHEAETGDEVSWFEAGSKGLLLVAVAGLVGVPATALAVLPVVRRNADHTGEQGPGSVDTLGQVDRTVRRLCAGFGLLLLASVPVFGLARVRSLGSPSPGTAAEFLGTPVGGVWLLQAVLAVAVGAFTLAGLRGRFPRRFLLGGTAAGGVASVAAVAWTSHSATAIDRSWGFAVDFVHVLAAGLWVGGLVVLAVVLPNLHDASREVDEGREDHRADDDGGDDRREVGRGRDDRRAGDGGGDGPLVGNVLRRYSVLALAGATFAVATGLVLASWHVTTVEGLTGTFYGVVLVVKLALVALALVLGGYHRFVLLPRLEPPSATLLDLLRRRPTRSDGGHGRGRVVTTVRVELVVLVCVLLLSGVLTSAATAAVVAADDGPEQGTVGTTLGDGVEVELSALPGVVDATGQRLAVEENDVVVFDVTFEREGEPVDSDRPVEFLATSPDGTVVEQEFDRVDEGTYSVVQALPGTGSWEVRVTGQPAGSFESAWFDVFAFPDASTHDHDHGHGGDSEPPFGEPLRIAGIVVALYGLLALAYELNTVFRRSG